MKRILLMCICMCIFLLVGCAGTSNDSEYQMRYKGYETTNAVDKDYHYATVSVVNLGEKELDLASKDFVIELAGVKHTATGFISEMGISSINGVKTTTIKTSTSCSLSIDEALDCRIVFDIALEDSAVIYYKNSKIANN